MSLKAPFLVLRFSYYTLLNFLMMLSTILLSVLIMLHYTLSLARLLNFRNSYSWPLNFYLWDTVDWGRKCLLYSNAMKNLLFYHLNNYDAIDVKMDRSVLDEKSSFKTQGSISFLNWVWALTLFQLLKLQWNYTFMSGIALPITGWICLISYRNGYVQLLVLLLLLLLNPCFIVET